MSHPSFDAPPLESLAALLPAYEFEQLIAVGGMGAVYKAKQRSLDRDVAIKILPPEMGADPEFRASFETEARAMARLNHPNLIGVYDSGTIDDMFYIVMEYVPGKSLYHSAYDRKIDPIQAVSLVKGICAGLGHAHENGIIHRDIKPANILLTPKAEPKIGDFGLARPDEDKGTGLVMGTPGYAAPEVISNPHIADRRSDLFAVGVILYELLTGARQEPGAKPPSTLCGCDPALDAIWQRATHPNPSFRYPDAHAFQVALDDWKNSQSKPAAAAKKPFSKALATPPSRKGTLVTAAPSPPRNFATPDAPDPDAPATTPPPPEVVFETATNWSFVRNLIIIATLILVIAGTWKKLESARIQRDKINRETIARENQERAKREIEAKERAIAIAQQPKPTTPPATDPAKPVTPVAPPPPPEPETPAKSLARLRYDLVSGDRAEMPLGSIRRGESDFFLVTDPLPWPAAASFAEQHGGHLFIPATPEDLNWAAQLLPPESAVWVGAGRSGRNDWSLVNGTAWSLPTVPRGTGSHASISSLGLVRATPATEALPFLIQWRRDGSNPATLAACLQATRQTLTQPTPLFPPGTQAIGTRHYLVVIRSIAFRDAAELAEKSGGHLAVASEDSEAVEIDSLAENLVADDGLWLGGMKPAADWVWVTGEPWKYATWADENPSQNANSALVTIPGKGWAPQDPSVQVNGFIIEWSKDRESTARAAPGVDVPAGTGIDDLLARAKDLVIAADKKRNDQLAANAKNFAWDLDLFMRGLSKSDQLIWQPEVNDLKATVRGLRVPEQIPVESGIKLSAPMAKVAAYCAEKQRQIDSSFISDADRIRMAYIGRVREAFANAEQRGQRDAAIALRQLLVDSGKLEPWIESFGIEPRPPNPVPKAVGGND
jgi:serine/threonine protein kinase